LQNNAPSRMYSTFHSPYFPETSYLSLSAHGLQTLYVWLKSVNNEGHFTWRRKYLFECISPSIRRIFLKLYTSLFRRMCYKRCRFCWSRSIMKGVLLVEQSTYSSVSSLSSQEWCNWNFIPLTSRAWAVIVLSLVEIGQWWKAHYLETKTLFGLYRAFHMSDVNETSYLALSAHALQNLYIWWKSVNKEGNFTSRKSTFSCVSRLPIDICSWNFTPRSSDACVKNFDRLVEIEQ
jgi:hypothetical protein